MACVCKAPKLAPWKMGGGSRGWTPPFRLAGRRTKSPEVLGERVTPLGQRLGGKWDCGQSEQAPARARVLQPRDGWREKLVDVRPQCPLQGASGREHAWRLQEEAQNPPGR